MPVSRACAFHPRSEGSLLHGRACTSPGRPPKAAFRRRYLPAGLQVRSEKQAVAPPARSRIRRYPPSCRPGTKSPDRSTRTRVPGFRERPSTATAYHLRATGRLDRVDRGQRMFQVGSAAFPRPQGTGAAGCRGVCQRARSGRGVRWRMPKLTTPPPAPRRTAAQRVCRLQRAGGRSVRLGRPAVLIYSARINRGRLSTIQVADRRTTSSAS